MKLKIAGLSVLAISLILIVLTVFIYFTVYVRVLQLRENELSQQADSIATFVLANPEPPYRLHERLRQFIRREMAVVVVSKQGQVVTSMGDYSAEELLAISQSKSIPTQFTVDLSGDRSVIYTAVPLAASATTADGYIILVESFDDVKEYMESLAKVLLIGSFGSILLAGIGGYMIAAAALRPVYKLMGVVNRIEVNRLTERVDVPKGRDEVAQLTRMFNQMLSRMERSFAQQSQFVADASHEMRTPLTTILGYVNLLQRWGKTDRDVLDKAIAVIQKESQRLHELIDDMLLLASLEADVAPEIVTTQIDERLHEIIDEWSMIYPNVEWRAELECPGVVVNVSPLHFTQITMNLLSNSLKYTAPGGLITVRTKTTNGHAVMEVEDTGCGIPAEDLPHIFDRFYRVDKSRERARGGSGLGLAIVKEIVESYRGHIDIKSELAKGTNVIIDLQVVSING